MSNTATKAKIFAMWVSTDNPHIKAMCWRKLEKLRATDAERFYTKDGQKYTVHGDIEFGERVEAQTQTAYAPPPPKPKRQKWGPYSAPHKSGPKRRHAPPPKQPDSAADRYSYGTEPRRTGRIKPTPTPTRDYVAELEDDYRRSQIQVQNSTQRWVDG